MVESSPNRKQIKKLTKTGITSGLTVIQPLSDFSVGSRSTAQKAVKHSFGTGV